MLFDIIKIVSSKSISAEGTIFLHNLIKEHHRLYISKFPEEPLTPKQHFMTHYPRVIRKLGPICQYSCLRFEGMHKPLKNYAKLCNNFQNIAKTLAKKYQSSQSYRYLLKKPVDQHRFNLFDQSIVQLQSLEAANEIRKELNIAVQQLVTISSRVEVYGYEFRIGCMLTLSPEDNDENSEPLFTQIINVVVRGNEVYFIGKDWETLGYERHLHAFAVKPLLIPQFRICKQRDLREYIPLHATQSHDASNALYYIAIRSRCI